MRQSDPKGWISYPINCGGTPFSDPKFLGGSKGYAGCAAGHASRPLLTLHAFQNVHRERAAAPGIPEVSASRKKNWFVGFVPTAPPRRVRRMRRMAPAMRIRETKPRIGPASSLALTLLALVQLGIGLLTWSHDEKSLDSYRTLSTSQNAAIECCGGWLSM